MRSIELNKKTRWSSIILILANLIPLLGVIFFGWQIGPILYIFWVENLIIGFYNIIQMIFASKPENSRVAGLFLSGFFFFHYGFFCAGHLFFLYALFDDHMENVDLSSGVFFAIIGLFVSHGFSLVVNYFKSGRYLEVGAEELMAKPYARILILHATIILSGFFVAGAGNSMAPLLLLVALKIVVDLFSHLLFHSPKKTF